MKRKLFLKRVDITSEIVWHTNSGICKSKIFSQIKSGKITDLN